MRAGDDVRSAQEPWDQSFLPGRALKTCFGPSEKHWPTRRDQDHAARMLVAEASELLPGRQVFWLSAASGFRTAFPDRLTHGPVARNKVRRPRRSQRRPRNGFAPFSLF